MEYTPTSMSLQTSVNLSLTELPTVDRSQRVQMFAAGAVCAAVSSSSCTVNVVSAPDVLWQLPENRLDRADKSFMLTICAKRSVCVLAARNAGIQHNVCPVWSVLPIIA